VTFTNPAYALQGSSHGAQLFRQATSSPLNPAGGILQPGDLALTQNGSPNMSVNVAAGRCWIPGTSLPTVNPGGGAYNPQGSYFAENDAPVNLAISASDPSNPRIDTVICQVQDAAYVGSTNSVGPVVVTGTPTSGATLANLTGAAAVPGSSLVLGYVLVPANATTIVTADLASTAAVLSLVGLGYSGPIGGATVRGAVVNAGPGTRTSAAYGALSDAADQVAGIVLPTNGLIAVRYQAIWQESVAGAARAAIFLNGNQLQIQGTQSASGPLTSAAATNSGFNTINVPLFSCPQGLTSMLSATNYASDVTTGQAIGMGYTTATTGGGLEMGGTVEATPAHWPPGGTCYIFAAAGTYTVSVKFKSASGSVTASGRKLWVEALPFG
jgi:hypothetical protein